MILNQKTLILVLAFAFIVCFASKINALEISEKGFKTGINLSNSTGEFASDAKSKIGFVGGVFVTSRLSHKFSIQTELLYSMKGYSIDDTGWDLNVKTTFTYLQLPLLLKMNLLTIDQLKLSILAGPSFSYNLSAKYDTTFDDENFKGNIEVNEYDIGLNLGLGLQKIITNSRSIILDLRYEFGLLNWDGDEHNDENYHRTLSILFGVSI